MIVCICNRLTAADIEEVITKDTDSMDVYGLCGVRMKCGQCEYTIADMIKELRGDSLD